MSASSTTSRTVQSYTWTTKYDTWRPTLMKLHIMVNIDFQANLVKQIQCNMSFEPPLQEGCYNLMTVCVFVGVALKFRCCVLVGKLTRSKWIKLIMRYPRVSSCRGLLKLSPLWLIWTVCSKWTDRIPAPRGFRRPASGNRPHNLKVRYAWRMHSR